MNNIIKNIKLVCVAALLVSTALISCNKEVFDAGDIAVPGPNGAPGVAATIAASPNYSFYNALINRAGFAATLNDTTRSFTIFATDNDGMKLFVNAASGGAVPLNAPDANFLGFINGVLPVASAAGIVQYATVGGRFPAASLGTGFPNFPLPSQIILAPATPFVRLNIFPSRGTPFSYVNDLPLKAVDLMAGNGIIHTAASVAAPPSSLLFDAIATVSNLSYYRAAVVRADSGNTSATSFTNLLKNGGTNMTVLTPNDDAFKALVYGLVYQAVFAQTGSVAIANANANGAVAAGPAFLSTNNVTTAQVRGIIAYHFLASNTPTGFQPNIRVFSVNVRTSPTVIRTLVNSGVASHPGIEASTVFAGPFTSSFTFKGVGAQNLTPIGSFGGTASVVNKDRLAVNGIFHIIDRVLLPL
jgi:uncharacterized surface protein with fasciclin (FAS1) repeats